MQHPKKKKKIMRKGKGKTLLKTRRNAIIIKQ